MGRGKNRRPSSIVRDNMVHGIYKEIMAELGDAGCYVSRGYIYDRIKEKTSLCTKTIAYILNYTTETTES